MFLCRLFPVSCLECNGIERIEHDLMIREGDKFKEGRSGKVFTVKRIHSDRIMLEAEDGSFQSVIIPGVTPSSEQNEERINGKLK
jgi:hypothetical protein